MKKLKFNNILYIIMIILVVIFLLFLNNANILPIKYLVIVIMMMLLWLLALYFLLVFKSDKIKKRNIIGYVISIFLVIIMAIIFYYLSVTLGFFKGFGKNTFMEENYLVLVSKNSNYDDINDLDTKSIGYVSNELTNIDKAISKLNEIIKINEIGYEKYDELFKDLINNEVEGILIDQSALDLIEENGEYDDFYKVIYELNLKLEIKEENKAVDVTKDTFSIYISGIDTYGNITSKSRSDVNIIATINPLTKQVLLISIPRDYYVQLSGTTSYKDKLTHAGIYGIDTSLKTIEELLNEDINYYIRVNFSSLQKVVDALGGIDVYSKYTFDSGQGYIFYKGYNHLNGMQALIFSRDRYHLPNGDISRNENQRAVIDGLIRKATSAAIITKYSSILSSLDGSFQTNMEEKDIQKLIKMQLNDMASWNVTSYGLTGTDNYDYTYTYQHEKLYVMIPNEESVVLARNLIDKVEAGEILESSFENVTDVKNPGVVTPKPPVIPDDSNTDSSDNTNDLENNDNIDNEIENNDNNESSDNNEVNSDEITDEDVNDNQDIGNDDEISSDSSDEVLEPPLDEIIDLEPNDNLQ